MFGYHMSRCDSLLIVRVDVVRSFVLVLSTAFHVSIRPGCMNLCVYGHVVLCCSGCVICVPLVIEDNAQIRDPKGAIL